MKMKGLFALFVLISAAGVCLASSRDEEFDRMMGAKQKLAFGAPESVANDGGGGFSPNDGGIDPGSGLDGGTVGGG